MKKIILLSFLMFGAKAAYSQKNDLTPSYTITESIKKTDTLFTDKRLIECLEIDYIIINGTIVQDEFKFDPKTGTIFTPVYAGSRITISFKK